MIELHSWPTPNGLKVSIFLEEAGLEHKVFPVNIGKGQQFEPDFLSFSPNNRIPAIRDLDPADGGEPVTVFESGAILVYLADKTGKFLPKETRARNEAMQWLMWQMGGFGPMLGQNHHFNRYAPEQIDYAINRYVNETARLYGVLDRQLEGRDYVTGEYSIADMATYPWAVPYEAQKQDLNDFPNVKRWFETMAARPAVIRVYESKDALYPQGEEMTEEEKAKLFGIKK
ncbi:MAG: glutathione binding-like protein [Sphingobium sp.]|nr:glutathione S-transferase N-terminal domain-containing protein [Sphingobium sp.]MCP5399274.1 glutathione S-transferase N-terminal domain-containing protein [Sphingomonas sp.]